MKALLFVTAAGATIVFDFTDSNKLATLVNEL